MLYIYLTKLLIILKNMNLIIFYLLFFIISFIIYLIFSRFFMIALMITTLLYLVIIRCQYSHDQSEAL